MFEHDAAAKVKTFWPKSSCKHFPPASSRTRKWKEKSGRHWCFSAGLLREADRWKSEWKIIWLQNLQPQEKKEKPHVPASTIVRWKKKTLTKTEKPKKSLGNVWLALRSPSVIEGLRGCELAPPLFTRPWPIYLGPLGCGCNKLLAVKNERVEKRTNFSWPVRRLYTLGCFICNKPI